MTSPTTTPFVYRCGHDLPACPTINLSGHQMMMKQNSETTSPITEPYLLVVSVPLVIDEQGNRWTDPLWAKDLALHLDYLDNLTLASPARRKEPGDDLVSLNQAPFDRLKFVDLPMPSGRLEALLDLPREVGQLWRAIGQAEVVHTTFAGWPINKGWLVTPLARISKKISLDCHRIFILENNRPGYFLAQTIAELSE